MDVLKASQRLQPRAEVIFTAGHADAELAVQALKHGAFYYLAKPFRLEEVRKVVAEALEKACLRRESDALQREAERYRDSEGIVTQGPAMGRLLETARQIAPTDCNVLITGASGTRARNCWPKTSTATAPGGEARSSASTAVFSTNSCSPTSCSDMKRVPSPAPWPKATR